MSGLKQLKTRIKAVKSTRKITKAMQLGAASKLKKAKEAVIGEDGFLRVVNKIMHEFSCADNIAEFSYYEKRFFSEKNESNILAILVTSERGLCGGFNNAVINRLKADINSYEAEGKNISLLIVGKKGFDALKQQYLHLAKGCYNIEKDAVDPTVMAVSGKIAALFSEQAFDICYLYYNKFKNAVVQEVIKERLIPFTGDSNSNKAQDVSEYEYEGEELIRQSIEFYIYARVRRAILQSRAAEEAARMTAMDSATKNAVEIMEKLTLKLNRSRQARITTEITEIIAGTEALS